MLWKNRQRVQVVAAGLSVLSAAGLANCGGNDRSSRPSAAGTGGAGGSICTPPGCPIDAGDASLDAASTDGAGGTGDSAVVKDSTATDVSSVSGAVFCGDITCDIGLGEVCCWDPVADAHSCAKSCGIGFNTFACDDATDCVSGQQCELYTTGSSISVNGRSVVPYASRCQAGATTTLGCMAEAECAGSGDVCCTDLSWVPVSTINPSAGFVMEPQGTSCTAASACAPTGMNHARVPLCRGDAECSPEKKCARLDGAPPWLGTCSAVANGIVPKMVDCGAVQCPKDLGLECCYAGSSTEYPCGVCNPNDVSFYAECDEAADCSSGQYCWFTNAGVGEQIVDGGYTPLKTARMVCSASSYLSLLGFRQVACNTEGGCVSGTNCCVFEGAIEDGGVRGVLSIVCETPTWCPGGANPYSEYGYRRCSTNADCLYAYSRASTCVPTEIPGVSYCN